MSAIDFINFRKLNDHYGLCRSAIRRDYIPIKYQSALEELKDLIEYWIKRNERPEPNTKPSIQDADVRTTSE